MLVEIVCVNGITRTLLQVECMPIDIEIASTIVEIPCMLIEIACKLLEN
jgi:hypothetical protein